MERSCSSGAEPLLPPTHQRGPGRGPGSLAGPHSGERRAQLLCTAPERAERPGLDLVAKLDSAEERLRPGLTQLSSSGPASAGNGFLVPLDAPLSGGGCTPSVLGLSSRSNNYVLVSQISLASPSPRGWLPFLQLASGHRIIAAEPSEAALNSPKSQGAARSVDGAPCAKAGRAVPLSENAPGCQGLPSLVCRPL